MSTIDTFRDGVESADLAAVTDTFAEDIRLFSPVKFRPFEGIHTVSGLFMVLLRTLENFRYVGQFTGTVDEDGGSESHILIFRATVNGKDVHGIDLIQLNDAGKIATFTVMVRPLSGLSALGDAIYAGLVADGVLPAS
jgi:hypothetical protein